MPTTGISTPTRPHASCCQRSCNGDYIDTPGHLQRPLSTPTADTSSTFMRRTSSAHLPDKDADCTCTSLFDNVNNLHQSSYTNHVISSLQTIKHIFDSTRSASPSSYTVVIKPRCRATTFKSISTSTPTFFPDIVLAPTRRSFSTDMSFSDEANHCLPGTDEAKASHQVRPTRRTPQGRAPTRRRPPIRLS